MFWFTYKYITTTCMDVKMFYCSLKTDVKSIFLFKLSEKTYYYSIIDLDFKIKQIQS